MLAIRKFLQKVKSRPDKEAVEGFSIKKRDFEEAMNVVKNRLEI